MRWKILGLIPLITATGPDITRSAAGRLAAETIWLPSVLAGEAVTWTGPDPSCARMSLTLAGKRVNVDLTIDDTGRLERLKLKRWGNPDGGEHQYAEFGGYVEREETFDGNRIPAQLRVGWHFGTERFESEDEFFRATIDQAEFR